MTHFKSDEISVTIPVRSVPFLMVRWLENIYIVTVYIVCCEPSVKRSVVHSVN
nr:MAG TPA: hypothetical protein [Caudoviricetes sp.]